MIDLVEGSFKGLAGVEVELFRKHLAGLKGEGLEIGCCDGYSSCIILEASRLWLTSIDPLIPDSMESSLCGSLERLRANTQKYGDRFEHFKISSQETDCIKSGLDFLFIDGDHSYEAALYDYMKFSSYIGFGGILAMHDARMGRDGSPNFHEGPSRVAREHLFGNAQWEILGEAFTLVIARKVII